MRKKVLLVSIIMVMILVLTACGSKDIKGKWRVIEVSEDGVLMFPTSFPNSCIANGESCTVDFLSDGSVLVNAVYEDGRTMSSDLCTYSIVDGKLKTMSALGSTAFTEFKKSGKQLRITDDKGSYVVLEKE